MRVRVKYGKNLRLKGTPDRVSENTYDERNLLRWVAWFVLSLSAACAFAQQDGSSSPPPAPPEAAQPASQDSPGPAATPLPAASNSSTLPDAPSHPAEQPATPASKQQPKRILGVMPNFRAVSPGTIPPPPTPKQSSHTRHPEQLRLLVFHLCGYHLRFGRGDERAPRAGKRHVWLRSYYWRGFVDKTDGNYWVIFILPTILHQDERYFAMGEGGFWKRSTYAATRIFVARKYQRGQYVQHFRGCGPRYRARYLDHLLPEREQHRRKARRQIRVCFGARRPYQRLS